MVSPDDILEAVDALPLEESWDLIRSYLDEGGDIDDLSADGITILNHFLKDFEMDDEAGLGFVRFLLERGADVNQVDGNRRVTWSARRGTGRFGYPDSSKISWWGLA